jgi:hypothetical protein
MRLLTMRVLYVAAIRLFILRSPVPKAGVSKDGHGRFGLRQHQ